MKIIGRLNDNICPVGADCPRVHNTDGDHVIVQGDAVGVDAVEGLDELPAGEALVAVPRTLLYPDALDVPDMLAYLGEKHTFDLFRWEGRDSYQSASDADDVARYLRGESQPASPARDDWFAKLAEETSSGRAWRKVHGVRGPLTEYERYEFEWGFAATTQHGEQVGILETHDLEALDDLPDFFVLDRAYVLVSMYDEAGRLIGGLPVTGPERVAFLAAADLITQAAIPFGTWWANHPQYHRRRVA